MHNTVRQRLTYANVMSTLAVFVALGGTSYAAIRLDGRSIENRSIPAKKLKRNAITGREVRESRLARVPEAGVADRLSGGFTGGFTAADLRVRCPLGTFPAADVCVETQPRSPAPYGTAVIRMSTSQPSP